MDYYSLNSFLLRIFRLFSLLVSQLVDLSWIQGIIGEDLKLIFPSICQKSLFIILPVTPEARPVLLTELYLTLCRPMLTSAHHEVHLGLILFNPI